MGTKRLFTAWDELGRDEIRRLQAAKLSRYIQRCVYPFSRYYRDLFDRHSIRPDCIRSLDDLRRIPFSSKLDLLSSDEHPERAREFILIPDREKLLRRPSVMVQALYKGKTRLAEDMAYEFRPVMLTSTTGRSADPVPFVFTRHDIDNMLRTGRRLVHVLGARPEERLINMFPFAPHLAFWQTHYATVSFGVFSLSTGGGKVMGTEGNIRMISKIKAQGLIGMPTFLYHVLSQARDQGLRFPDLRTLVLGGEKVAPGMRRKLKALVLEVGGSEEADVVATYGFTEAKTAWGETPFPLDQPSSGYVLYPDFGLFEVIDPETGEVQGEGEPGELVYTPLDSRGSVVLRYRTGDYIDGGLVYEPCPYTGRQVPRLVGNISRKSNFKELALDKIKGTLVDFNQLERILDDADHVGAWQLELRKINDDPMELDELVLHVEKTNAIEEEHLAKQLRERFTSYTELCPNQILFKEADEMRRIQGVGSEIKEKRIVDNRPALEPNDAPVEPESGADDADPGLATRKGDS